MKIGVFVKNKEDARGYLDLPIDFLAIGSDGCVHLLPSEGEVEFFQDVCKKSGKRLRIYTPRIPQKHLERLQNYIELLASKRLTGFDLVVNDFGLLSWISHNKIEFNQIILGSGYSRSVLQNPLHENILRDEIPSIKKINTQSNNNNTRRLQYLKKMGIKGVEVEFLDEITSKIDKIRKEGLFISTVVDYMWVGYSRACPIARYNNKPIGECSSFCRTPYRIEMRQIWDVMTQAYPYLVQADKEIAQMYSPIFLLGNILYMKIDSQRAAPMKHFSEDDTVCFISAFYKEKEELRRLIEDIYCEVQGRIIK